jgi:uncharacterized protein
MVTIFLKNGKFTTYLVSIMFEINENRSTSPVGAFFLVLLFVFVGLVIGSLISFGIWYGMTGRPITSMVKDIVNPQFTSASRIVQFVGTLIGIFIPAIAGGMLMSRKPFKWLGYNEGVNAKQVILVIGIFLVSIPIVNTLTELNQIIPIPKSWETYFKEKETMYNEQMEGLGIIRSASEYILSLIILALLPAIFEETLFRGSLQQKLILWFKNPAAAIIVTSIIFSIFHMSYYGLLPRFALGVILGYMFYFSKSIWLSATAHFINNAMVVSFMYYLSLHGKPVKDITEDANMPIWWAVPSLILLIVLMKEYKKTSTKRLIGKIPPMDGPSGISTLA